MGKYLRIRNRGTCPRWLLQLDGASTKREAMADPKIGGWYGTDTKNCPIAALRLGIEVHVASSDEEGPYLATYTARRRRFGTQEVDQVVMEFDKGPPFVTGRTTETCRNWTNLIGDDPFHSYRVLRGYLRNAVDADPNGWSRDFVDAPVWAPEGETHVFITRTGETDLMLGSPARYFKWLSTDAPIMRFTTEDQAFGKIWPKSESGMTRMFSQGSLAFCSGSDDDASLFDYDLDRKELAAEERGSFTNVSDAFTDVSRMLMSWADVERLIRLIWAIEEGRAKLEARVLGYLGHLKRQRPQAADAWKRAWEAAFGPKAVIATDDYSDQRIQHRGFKPVRLKTETLRAFLILCGVPTCTDLLPKMRGEAAEYREVPADRLNEQERARLELALAVFHADLPETNEWPVRFFVSLTEKMRPTRGFTQLQKDKTTEIWISRGCLLSIDVLMEVLEHEFRHARTGARDDDRRFVNRADKDLAAFRMDRAGLAHEPYVDVAALPFKSEVELAIEESTIEIDEELDRILATPDPAKT